MALCWVTHIFMASEHWHLPGPFLRDLLILSTLLRDGSAPGITVPPNVAAQSPPAPHPEPQITSTPCGHPRASAPTWSGTALLSPPRSAPAQHMVPGPQMLRPEGLLRARPLPPPTADPSASPADSLSRIQLLLSCPNPSPGFHHPSPRMWVSLLLAWFFLLCCPHPCFCVITVSSTRA